jgi:ABC-type uncharacterized transport system auxiliary subunit
MFLLAACTSLLPAQPYMTRADWPLAPLPATSVQPDPRGAVVAVRAITAGPGLDRRGVASIASSGAISYDYYNQWAVDPAAAVTGDLAIWLAASGRFSAVVDPASRLDASLIVEGELTEFVADVRDHTARATLTLTVLGSDNGAVTLRGQRRIEGRAVLAGSDPASVIEAQRAALADALSQSVALVTTSAR